MEKVGQSLSQALEAAQAVSLPTDAFGKLCAFLPTTIRRFGGDRRRRRD
ncbi:hypothetical protein ACIHDR_34365 [Nocardia sp. NPDC052278]